MLSLRPGNAQWIGQRPEQQDAFGFHGCNAEGSSRPEGVLVVVADGMGGLRHGREASQVAVKTLLTSYAAQSADLPVTEALSVALHAANQAVYALARATEGAGEVGTTLIAAAVRDGRLYWVGVGDSRLYLYRARDDSLTPCNESHTLENQLWSSVPDGTMTPEAIAAHPDRDALTSFLGLVEIPQVDASRRPLALQPGDRLLLCSDGVDAVLSGDQLKQALSSDSQTAANALIEQLKTRRLDHQDNATVAILACESSVSVKESENVTDARRGSGLRLLASVVVLLLLLGAATWFGLSNWWNLPPEATQAPVTLVVDSARIDSQAPESPATTADVLPDTSPPTSKESRSEAVSLDEAANPPEMVKETQ